METRVQRTKHPTTLYTDNDTDIYNVHIIHVSVPLVCPLYNIALYHAVCWCVFSIGKGGGGGAGLCVNNRNIYKSTSNDRSTGGGGGRRVTRYSTV